MKVTRHDRRERDAQWLVLWSRWRGGDDHAGNALFNRLLPHVIRATARKRAPSRDPIDDDALAAYWTFMAMRTYDPSSGTPLVRWAVLKVSDKSRRDAARDRLVSNQDERTSSEAEPFTASLGWDFPLTGISPLGVLCIDRYLSGLGWSDVSRETGIPESVLKAAFESAIVVARAAFAG